MTSATAHTAARLGIDISKATFDVHLCLTDGATHSLALPNDAKGFAALDAWLKKLKATRTCAGLEATGPYGHALLAHLHAQGHLVHQLNPRRVKDYARSQGRKVKTDRTDAALIASYLKATEDLLPWQPPEQALVQLQALVRRRIQLLDMIQAERNRLLVSSDKAVTASHKRQLKHLQGELKQINLALKEQVAAHPAIDKNVRLLLSIHGVGLINAVTLLAEVPHLKSFQRARELAAYAGLTPSIIESGTSVRRRGGMTREGSALLRKMLYMAALQSVKRTNNAFHKMYQAFVARGKAKMTALGAVMHKIIRVCFGVLKHQTPFMPNFANV